MTIQELHLEAVRQIILPHILSCGFNEVDILSETTLSFKKGLIKIDLHGNGTTDVYINDQLDPVLSYERPTYNFIKEIFSKYRGSVTGPQVYLDF